jgi:hypothetical protein
MKTKAPTCMHCLIFPEPNKLNNLIENCSKLKTFILGLFSILNITNYFRKFRNQKMLRSLKSRNKNLNYQTVQSVKIMPELLYDIFH